MIVQFLILFIVFYIAFIQHKLSNEFITCNSKLDKLTKSGQRIEATAANVAEDLSDAHFKADAIRSNNYGEAADVANEPSLKEKIKKGVL